MQAERISKLEIVHPILGRGYQGPTRSRWQKCSVREDVNKIGRLLAQQESFEYEAVRPIA
jgi:hypothetical protein